MTILRAFSCVFVISLTVIGTNADKNPTGSPLGYYPKHPHSYYKKPASYYRKCVPSDTTLDVKTHPSTNGGRPYHDCRYTISTLEGRFFRDNGTFFPCKTQKVLDILKVGEPLPKELQVMKGVQEGISVKFPLPIAEAAAGRPNSVPVTGTLATETFLFLKNTSVHHKWAMDTNFFDGLQNKLKIIRENSKLYRDTQLELLMSLHEGLSNVVDSAELTTQNRNQNTNQNDRKDAKPLIALNIQTFGSPTTRIIEENYDEDHIQAERTFGLAGQRIEFQDPKKVAQVITKLAGSNVGSIDIGDLGSSPQDASRNTVNMHQSFFDLARRTQYDLDDYIIDQAGSIIRDSQFNFRVSSNRIPIPDCGEDIEVDPIGQERAGSMSNQVGMGK